MAIAVFPQAVLAPDVHAQLSAVMADQNATAFTNGFPSGEAPELGDGWHIGPAYNETLSPSVVETLSRLVVPYITVRAAKNHLMDWPAVWHTPNTDGTGHSTLSATVGNAVAAGWFHRTSFRHQGACGHLVLAAVVAGGVLARTCPVDADQDD